MGTEPSDQPGEAAPSSGSRELACVQCGADLKYNVGASSLACPYCAAENEIPVLSDKVGERDFRSFLQEAKSAEHAYEIATAKCVSCGAESTLDANVTHDSCPFCGVPIEAMTAADHSSIEPQSLLPFSVPAADAQGAFKKWLKSLWFAPNTLKRMQNLGHKLQGVFLPHWTYDTDCLTEYVGQRGIYYWVTEHYTTTDANGKSVRRSRQVRKTRWYPAVGSVTNRFDDLLVPASSSLPPKYVEALEPWGLKDLVATDRSYMAGFKTERYTVDLEDGFASAAAQMVDPIEQTIRMDIGGDAQRIFDRRTDYRCITFKHILLPVWISAYRYKGKVFRFLVNARTGEVQGERPWSVWKITFAVIGGLILLAAIGVGIAAANQ